MLLAELRRRDVRVWIDGTSLRCDAPAGVLTADLREQLRTYKEDVLEFLRATQRLAVQERAIVPLQRSGGRPPIFAVPGHNGDVFCFRALAKHFGNEQPFFGLEPPGLDGQSEPLLRVEDLAAYFAAQVRAFRPEGPCIIAGYCAGGTVAFELARQLQRQGADIPYLALFGSPHPSWYRFFAQLRWRAALQLQRMGKHFGELASRPSTERCAYLREKINSRKSRRDDERMRSLNPVLFRRVRLEQATLRAVRRYTPESLVGRVGLFLPSSDAALGRAVRRWRTAAPHAEQYLGPHDCDAFNMLREPHAAAFAELFRRSLAGQEQQN